MASQAGEQELFVRCGIELWQMTAPFATRLTSTTAVVIE